MLINHCIQNANSILLFLEPRTFPPHNLLPINLKGSMKKDQLAQKFWLASFSLQFQCFIKSIVQIYMLEISFLESGLWHLAQVRNVSSWDQPKGNKWVFPKEAAMAPCTSPCWGLAVWAPGQGSHRAHLCLHLSPGDRMALPAQGGLYTPKTLHRSQDPGHHPDCLLISVTSTSSGWHQPQVVTLPFKHSTPETLGLSWKSQKNSVPMMWVCKHFSLYNSIQGKIPLYNSIQGKIWKVV